MTRFLAVIPVKLVLVKTGNGNPEKSLTYFLKVAYTPSYDKNLDD
jgi:hypothetical protein